MLYLIKGESIWGKDNTVLVVPLLISCASLLTFFLVSMDIIE